MTSGVRALLVAAGNLERKVVCIAKGWEAEFAIGMDLLFSPTLLMEDVCDFYVMNDTRWLRMTAVWIPTLAARRQAAPHQTP